MSERRFLLLNGCMAATVGLAVLVGLRFVALSSGAEPAPPISPARPPVAIPAIAQVLRSLKLVTVEITTAVTSESVDRSWRGDVQASVRAPARLYYGVDMSGLADSAAARDPLSGEWVIRVPAPRRLAIEVFASDEQPAVQVTGTRLRDVAGEYHLGQARQKLYDRAHDMVLTPEQRDNIERLSRDQIAALVRGLVGESIPVRVEFERSEFTAGAEPVPPQR